MDGTWGSILLIGFITHSVLLYAVIKLLVTKSGIAEDWGVRRVETDEEEETWRTHTP